MIEICQLSNFTHQRVPQYTQSSLGEDGVEMCNCIYIREAIAFGKVKIQKIPTINSKK